MICPSRPVLALLLVLVPFPARLEACTLWAAIGDVAGGGTLLSKNRDWRPDHRQSMKVVHPRQGFAYCGLFAEEGEDPGLKAGVNAAGLSIVSASTNLPKKAKEHQPGKHGVMAQILERYATVGALAADADAVFSGARTSFYMVSDRKQVLLVEVGLEGRFSARLVAAGTVAHTNHFLDPGLAAANNDRIGDSSARRLARVQELLDRGKGPFTLAQFVAISRDQHDGPDNSLWRSGKEWTLASWIIATPKAGNPRLRVVIANPGEPQRTVETELDEAFWKEGLPRP